MPTATAEMPASHLLFLGTYTRSGASRGIYSVRMDPATGQLSAPKLAAEAADPGWIVFSPDRRFAYAVHASPAQAVAFRVDHDRGELERIGDFPAVGGMAGPCHLASDQTGRVLVAANYHEGFVATLPVQIGRAHV